MFRTYCALRDDPFNISGNRSVNNTSKKKYNCAGYALGTFSWYCPHTEEDDNLGFWFGYDYSFRSDKEAWTKTMYAVSQMVLDFNGQLRMIMDISQLRKDERVVAFRLSSDGDFHYVKRSNGGHWYHKRGGSLFIERMSKKAVFETNWCDRYDGPIILLAIKK